MEVLSLGQESFLFLGRHAAKYMSALSSTTGIFQHLSNQPLQFPATPNNVIMSATLQVPATPTMRYIKRCWPLWVTAADCCCWLMDRATITIHFSFLREQRRNHSRVQSVSVIRRSDGGHVVEVGIETVSPGRKVDRRVLAGDLDQVLGLVTCERGL